MKKIFSIFIFFCAIIISIHAEQVLVGAEQTKEYLPLLKDKRVA